MQPNLTKVTMSNGLILGALFSVKFLLSTSESYIASVLQLALFTLILVHTYRSSIKNREINFEGTISYFKAFNFVFLSFFFGGIISSIVKFVYFQFINPEYLVDLLDKSSKLFEEMKIPFGDAEYDQLKEILKPASFSLQFIWMNSLLGMITGSIMAFFIKKEKNIFE